MIDGISSGGGFSPATLSGPRPGAAQQSAPPPSTKPVGASGNLPGQAGGGIGDLQSVAPSSIARGQIVDIAA